MKHLEGINPSLEVEYLKLDINNVRENNLFYNDDIRKNTISKAFYDKEYPGFAVKRLKAVEDKNEIMRDLSTYETNFCKYNKSKVDKQIKKMHGDVCDLYYENARAIKREAKDKWIKDPEKDELIGLLVKLPNLVMEDDGEIKQKSIKHSNHSFDEHGGAQRMFSKIRHWLGKKA
jgi:hypothetical protein